MATLAQILISKLPLTTEQMHHLQSEVSRQEEITAASLSQVIKMINNGKHRNDVGNNTGKAGSNK